MAMLDDLQKKRTKLVEARASGFRVVKYGEAEATFRSISEIEAAIAAVDREIAGLQGRRVTTFLPHFSNGVE